MAANERVVARPARQRVRAIARRDRVIAPAAHQGVGPARSRQGQRSGAFPRCAVEIARGEAGQRQIGQADQAPCRLQRQNTVIDEIDIDISTFLTRDDLPAEARRNADIEHIAQIARLEPGDGDKTRTIVDFRHEEGEGIHDPGRCNVVSGQSRRSARPARPAAAVIARIAAMGAGKDRIGEGIGARCAWEQQPLRLGLGHQFGQYFCRGQGHPAREAEQIHRGMRETELVADQKLILGADEAQQKIVALLDSDHIGQRQTGTELHRVKAARPGTCLHDLVAARTGAEKIGRVALSAGQRVIAKTTVERGVEGRRPEVDQIIARTTRRKKGKNIGQSPCFARGKDEFLDHASGAGEHVADRDPGLASCDPQNQIGGTCGENDDIFGQDACGETDAVDVP